MIKIATISASVVLSSFFSVSFAADAASGQSKAALCAGCHGADGISFSPEIPNLAGQKAPYLEKAVQDYKSGMRKNPMMSSIVANVSEADVADIAAYFSSLSAK
jgi:cytochrome c553